MSTYTRLTRPEELTINDLLEERWSRSKRKKKWGLLRPKLIAKFNALGLLFCWQCGTTNALTLAHRMIRDLIHSEEELATVAVLCSMKADGSKGCHQEIEYQGHEVNFREVTNLIQAISSRVAR